jgi:hypothetical protein
MSFKVTERVAYIGAKKFYKIKPSAAMITLLYPWLLSQMNIAYSVLLQQKQKLSGNVYRNILLYLVNILLQSLCFSLPKVLPTYY